MRSFIWILIGVMAFTLVSIAHANSVGDRAGNGGDAVVCKKEGKQTAMLLDAYEAGIHGIEIEKTPVDWTMRQNFEHVRSILERLDPVRVKEGWFLRVHDTDMIDQLMQEIERMELGSKNDGDFVRMTDNNLTDIDDSKEIELPDWCEKRQLIIQMNYCVDAGHWMPWDRMLTINRPTWNLLDNKNKAMALLHEIVYSEALCNGSQDSRGTRYFNAAINSSQFKDFSILGYAALLSSIAQSKTLDDYVLSDPSGGMEFTLAATPLGYSFSAITNQTGGIVGYSLATEGFSQKEFIYGAFGQTIHPYGSRVRLFPGFPGENRERAFSIDLKRGRTTHYAPDKGEVELYANYSFKSAVLMGCWDTKWDETRVLPAFCLTTNESDRLWSDELIHEIDPTHSSGRELVTVERRQDESVIVQREIEDCESDCLPRPKLLRLKLHDHRKPIDVKSATFGPNGNLVSYELLDERS